MTRSHKKTAAQTRRLIVRLTDEQQTQIRARARDSGLSVSEYVRRMAVGGQVVARRDTAYGMSLAHQLRRVGVNLNQLARVANSNGELPEGLAAVCGRIEIILDRVLRME